MPTSCIPWPTQGLRRISVDSFGFGGANSHIILDDAFYTIEALGLVGNHRALTSTSLFSDAPKKLANETDAPEKLTNGTNEINGVSHATSRTSNATPGHQLLTWSARDEAALKRMLHLYDGYVKTHMRGDANFLGDLAYALAARRTLMAWRSFSVVDGQGALETLDLFAAKCERAARDVGVAFVFTGQGAQYANMGIELLRYPIFQATLVEAHNIFQELGAEWSLLGKYGLLLLVHRWHKTAFVNYNR